MAIQKTIILFYNYLFRRSIPFQMLQMSAQTRTISTRKRRNARNQNQNQLTHINGQLLNIFRVRICIERVILLRIAINFRFDVRHFNAKLSKFLCFHKRILDKFIIPTKLFVEYIFYGAPLTDTNELHKQTLLFSL